MSVLCRISKIDCRTFADGHGCYDSLDRILAFIAVLAVEIDAELIVFAFARRSYAHWRWSAEIIAQSEGVSPATATDPAAPLDFNHHDHDASSMHG